MVWGRIALGLALAAVSQGAVAHGLFTVSGPVDASKKSKTEIAFTLDQSDLRFVMDVTKVPNLNAVLKALKASSDNSADISVSYDPDSGRLDPALGKPTFVVRELSYDGKTIKGDATAVPPAVNATPRDRAAAALV